MDLGRHSVRPGGKCSFEGVTITQTNRVVAVVVQQVPDYAYPSSFGELYDVSRAEGTVVIFDYQSAPSALG